VLKIQSPKEAREFSRSARAAGRKVALVPTMGFLHDGHLALVRAAKKEADVVMVSIFVNPTQFDRPDDLENYPRDLTRDLEMLEAEGVQAVFCPRVADMYPAGFQSFVTVEQLSRPLCGAGRPGHFRGVATVVAKLFNIVEPDLAFFGEKDFQQLQIVRRMVRDLDFAVEIKSVPTVREADGLALSSRNARLTPEQRSAARCLARALEVAERRVAEGEKSASALLDAVKGEISSEPLARLEYAEVCEPEGLRAVSKIEGPVLVALAVWFGSVRLIDSRVVAPAAVAGSRGAGEKQEGVARDA